MMEAPGLPKGVMWESCAIMQYLCNKHHLDKFYPTEPEKRAMVDSAMFYIVGTLYPYIVRSTYGALGFPQYAGRSRRQRRDAGGEGEGAEGGGRGGRRDARRVPQVLSRRQDLRRRRPRLDRRHPPRVQPRIPQGHRLPSIPTWAKTYMAAVAKALGDAYAEPAKDVEGYIAYVKGQKKG